MTSTGSVVVRPSRRRSTTHRVPRHGRSPAGRVRRSTAPTSPRRSAAPAPGSRARRAAAPSGVRRAAARARARRPAPSTTRPEHDRRGQVGQPGDHHAEAERRPRWRPGRCRAAATAAAAPGRSRRGRPGSCGLAPGCSPGDYTRSVGRPTNPLLSDRGDLSHTHDPICARTQLVEVVRDGSSRNRDQANSVRFSRPTAPRPSGAGTYAAGSRRSRTPCPSPEARPGDAWLAARERSLQPRPPPAAGARQRPLAAGVLDKLDTESIVHRAAAAGRPTSITTCSGVHDLVYDSVSLELGGSE